MTEFLLKNFKTKDLLWFQHVFLYQETDQNDLIKRTINLTKQHFVLGNITFTS